MKYKVGDVVRTLNDISPIGFNLFPIGTIGEIKTAKNTIRQQYEVSNGTESWWYCEDDLEAVKTYEQGLNDAWELALKYSRMSDSEREEVFNISNENFFFDYESMTPQEALAKLKAYEDSKIEVGDVIVYAMEKFVVLELKGDKVVVLTSDGNVLELHKCDVEKTGKHIDITSILEQISEV